MSMWTSTDTEIFKWKPWYFTWAPRIRNIGAQKHYVHVRGSFNGIVIRIIFCRWIWIDVLTYLEISPSEQQCCRENKHILRENIQMTNFDDYIDDVNPSIALNTIAEELCIPKHKIIWLLERDSIFREFEIFNNLRHSVISWHGGFCVLYPKLALLLWYHVSEKIFRFH